MRQLATIPLMALLFACAEEAGDPPTNAAPEIAAGNQTAAGPAGDGNASDPAGEDDGAANAGAEPGMRWNFSRAVTGPKLAYGEPNTDNVKLLLRCEGRDSIRLSFVRPAGSAGGEFVVSSGGAEQRFDATAIESEINGATIQAIAPIGSQPLQNFRGGSALQVRWQEETVSVPAAGEEARQFFESCRASG